MRWHTVTTRLCETIDIVSSIQRNTVDSPETIVAPKSFYNMLSPPDYKPVSKNERDGTDLPNAGHNLLYICNTIGIAWLIWYHSNSGVSMVGRVF